MEGNVASSEEVGKLADALQQPQFRRAFSMNADAAMEGASIDAAEIPADLLNTLRGLSLLELGVIARVNRELEGLKGNDVMIQMPV